MQDLIRGIKKLVGVERKQQVELEGEPSGNVQNDIEPLLIRTAMFLEDENWEKADEYAERILDMNPKCAQAYLDKMMAEYRVHSSDELMEYYCQTAHCGRYIPHFDFGAKPSPIVPYRHLPQSLSGMTADCRSLV